jgi:hypothetical protein
VDFTYLRLTEIEVVVQEGDGQGHPQFQVGFGLESAD